MKTENTKCGEWTSTSGLCQSLVILGWLSGFHPVACRYLSGIAEVEPCIHVNGSVDTSVKIVKEQRV